MIEFVLHLWRRRTIRAECRAAASELRWHRVWTGSR